MEIRYTLDDLDIIEVTREEIKANTTQNIPTVKNMIVAVRDVGSLLIELEERTDYNNLDIDKVLLYKVDGWYLIVKK